VVKEGTRAGVGELQKKKMSREEEMKENGDGKKKSLGIK
jgi:hypothetical protein